MRPPFIALDQDSENEHRHVMTVSDRVPKGAPHSPLPTAGLVAAGATCILGFALAVRPCFAEPMTFGWIAPCEGIGRICERRILAKGEIEWESGAKLAAFVEQKRHGDHSQWRGVELCFDSPGGDLQGALRLGEVIRNFQMDTCVESQYFEPFATNGVTAMSAPGSSRPSVCASACVFALAAGVHRTVGKGARIGIHQFVGANGELGQRRTQLAMAELAQYLEHNGVERKLLDSAAQVPHWMMRYLTVQEVTDTNLDNTAQIYETWKLGAWQDGTVYAHVEQRNPVTDQRTGLMLYKREDRVWLNVVVHVPGAEESNSLTGDTEDGRPEDANALMRTLGGAEIWLRADEEDFAEFAKAPWVYGTNGAYVRKLEIPSNKLAMLQTAHLLEIWVTATQLSPRHNPSMAFRLESLKPFLTAVLK